MSDEAIKFEISTFSSSIIGGSIKKKTDNSSELVNKVSETKISYTPANKQLKTTANIYSTTSVAKTETSPNTNSPKIEQPHIAKTSSIQNQPIQNEPITLSLEKIQKSIQTFAQHIQQSDLKEYLAQTPFEFKKDTITLFINIPEYELKINQMKNELLEFLKQNLPNPNLQIQIRKPYTDSEKLFFLKQKYNAVNELVNKLGLDLV
jgi:hypothetical protein